jgi:hypothetical protein
MVRMNPTAVAFWTALALVGLLVACDLAPSSPSPLPLRGDAPAPVLTRIAIEGPDSLPPGENAQFRATGHYSDGSSRDVTDKTAWRSSNPALLAISALGLATAHQPGEANISAHLEGRPSTKTVIIVPAGTYRVVGFVREADGPTLPIAGARVEVTAGSSAGLSTITGEDGHYRLYGVGGENQIHVTRNGYEPTVRAVVVADHQTLDFALALSRPRTDFSGTFALTIATAESCREKLPDAAWTRRYTAQVAQDGALIETKLTGATFALGPQGQGNGFRGRVEPDRVVFQLTGYDSYYGQHYADLVEQVDDSYFVAAGTAILAATPAGLTGTLDGTLEIYNQDLRVPPGAAPVSWCRSNGHSFTLSR